MAIGIKLVQKTMHGRLDLVCKLFALFVFIQMTSQFAALYHGNAVVEVLTREWQGLVLVFCHSCCDFFLRLCSGESFPFFHAFKYMRVWL